MSTTQRGHTPLVTAAHYGKWDVVIELLDNGADVNAQNDVSHNTVIVRSKCTPLPVTLNVGIMSQLKDGVMQISV